MSGWIAALAIALLVGALGAAAWRGGAASARQKRAEENSHDSFKAHAVRDRLRHDDDFAKRVRARFTR